MPLDVKKFYQVCNPSPLDLRNAQERKYYIDFSSVRGGNIIKELMRTIDLSPNMATCQLFTGHIGCGKSTELQQLKVDLEKENFHVVYVESGQVLETGDVDVTDIMLAIAQSVSESLEAIEIKLRTGYFVNLFREIAGILQTPIEIGDVEFSVGIAKITAQTKDSPKLRNQLRACLEPRTKDIIEAINHDMLALAQEKLKGIGKIGLVVIVDGLDKLTNVQTQVGSLLPEYLFVDRGEQLNRLNCHVVYTIPLGLIFSKSLQRLTNIFGAHPKVLPMVPVQLRQGGDCPEGMALLQQMVMARAFPDANSVQRLDLISQVFDSPATLERLCRVSGGHVRNLLMLIRKCIEDKDPPLSHNCIEKAIRASWNQLNGTINEDEWDLLRQVRKTKTIAGLEQYQTLVRNLFVFEYQDDDGSWFDVNPILLGGRTF
ncbi:KAP family NTPase [Argonema antarcticum]|uniref:KAP family NTPase n=1 Tax=Argonema antarcticum TaxID=2942763 RepID=UPI0020121EC9|nr:KAP family NTPase [Argonema antarcticum A004/B2]